MSSTRVGNGIADRCQRLSSGRYHISDPGSPLEGPTSSGVTQPP